MRRVDPAGLFRTEADLSQKSGRSSIRVRAGFGIRANDAAFLLPGKTGEKWISGALPCLFCPIFRDSGQFLQGGGDMKVDVPNGAVQVGRGEDNRIAVMINGADLEGAIMLDPQKFTEDEGKELGAMLWRVIERWQAARQPLK
jgi:hypothetical protein